MRILLGAALVLGATAIGAAARADEGACLGGKGEARIAA